MRYNVTIKATIRKTIHVDAESCDKAGWIALEIFDPTEIAPSDEYREQVTHIQRLDNDDTL